MLTETRSGYWKRTVSVLMHFHQKVIPKSTCAATARSRYRCTAPNRLGLAKMTEEGPALSVQSLRGENWLRQRRSSQVCPLSDNPRHQIARAGSAFLWRTPE